MVFSYVLRGWFSRGFSGSGGRPGSVLVFTELTPKLIDWVAVRSLLLYPVIDPVFITKFGGNNQQPGDMAKSNLTLAFWTAI